MEPGAQHRDRAQDYVLVHGQTWQQERLQRLRASGATWDFVVRDEVPALLK